MFLLKFGRELVHRSKRRLWPEFGKIDAQSKKARALARERSECVSALGARLQGEAGVAAIEFGLMAPFLIMLVVGTVEVGSGVYQAMQAQNAAEAGAVYASKYGFDSAGISSAVANATGAATPSTCITTPSACITAEPAPSQFCGCPADAGVTATDCASTCADGSAPGQYAQISAQITHTPILSFSGLVMPAAITGQAIVRMY